MPKPPETSDTAFLAERLARFLFSRGGCLPAALMSEFYAKHPDAQALLGGGKGKLHELCCEHPEKLQFCKKSSGDTVELAPDWKARPQPHLPCITLCNLVSALHEKGELSTRSLGRLEADERKAIAHCGGLEPLAYSYPELFRLSMPGPGQAWALRFSLRLQNLWECLSATLSNVGKAECGHVIGQLYKADEELKGVVATLGGAAGLAQAFRGSVEFQRREKEPGIEQQLFVWRRVKKSGSTAERERLLKRTTPVGPQVEGDGTQKEAICCFWLQGACPQGASHTFYDTMFLHELKPGLLCANGAGCSRHGKLGLTVKEEKDREPIVPAAAPAAVSEGSQPPAPAGKARTSRWGPSSAAQAPPAPPGLAADQAADQGLTGVSRERRTLERLSARLLGARDLARQVSLEAWEEELQEVSLSLAEVCDQLAVREEEMQRREASLAQQGSGVGLPSCGPPLDTTSSARTGGQAVVPIAGNGPGGEGSGDGLPGSSSPVSSSSSGTSIVTAAPAGSKSDGAEASVDGRSQKVDSADSTAELAGWARFIDPVSGRVWWWNALTSSAKWEDEMESCLSQGVA